MQKRMINGQMVAGPKLLDKSIARTRDNHTKIREERYARGSRKPKPSEDRYLEQRLNSFSYQAVEQALLQRLEELRNGMD